MKNGKERIFAAAFAVLAALLPFSDPFTQPLLVEALRLLHQLRSASPEKST